MRKFQTWSFLEIITFIYVEINLADKCSGEEYFVVFMTRICFSDAEESLKLDCRISLRTQFPTDAQCFNRNRQKALKPNKATYENGCLVTGLM